MRDLAEMLSKIKNAIVVPAGNEKCGGIKSCDYASQFVLQALHNYEDPVLSGMPLYSAMKKVGGSATS